MSLTINLATRGRPNILLETVKITLENMVRDDTMFMISADGDDQSTIDALGQLPTDKRLYPVVLDREDSVGAKYNRALVHAPADVYLVMVDYAPHVTPGFDQKVLDAAAVFPDNIGVVYNYLANASFPGINAVTAGLAKKMGYIYPTYFPYWFIDHWLDDIAKIINRISFADVHIDVSRKQNTMEYREPIFWTTFFDLGHIERRRIAHSIINSDDFLEPGWRKELSLRHHPLIEYRSEWVNMVVREESKRMIQVPPDERYMRLRNDAVKVAERWVSEMRAIQASLEAA